jgi:UDP-3-O-[3-hydroxymyristoyl] glucosamine N-acyltransferase LpxD
MRGYNVLRATLNEREIRRLIGFSEEGDRVVDGVAPLGAGEDRCLYFVKKEMAGPARESLAGRRGCVVIAPNGTGLATELSDCLVLETADPRAALAKVLGFIRTQGRQPRLVAEHAVSPSAVISPFSVVVSPVEIGNDVVVEPFCMVGPDVRIGRGTILRSGVRLFPRVVIGEHSVVGVNTVVGHDGYGFVRDESGNKTRIPHLGGVEVGSHVELGPLATVQSGTITPTIIDDYAKIGDGVLVGHNVRVGRNASITGGVAIGGSAVIETEAWVGINASIRDGRRVGSHARVGMDASVQNDISDHAVTRASRPAVESRSDDE